MDSNLINELALTEEKKGTAGTQDEAPTRLLRLKILAGRNLAKKDIFAASDSYVHVSLLTSETEQVVDTFCTRTKKRTLNPTWDEEFVFKVNPDAHKLKIEVFDENRLTRDDFLGLVELPLNDIPVENPGRSISHKYYILRPGSAKSRVKGHLQIYHAFIPSDGEEEEDTTSQQEVVETLINVVNKADPPQAPNNARVSELKRVFQRVACFPCEYLVDVHKLLFMKDCDMKDIRQNIFAFKGFPFGVDSQEFKQRKMYLEYLTFHSLRKISSVLTTKNVDLRNSTKHELSTHLTKVLTEYTNTYMEAEAQEASSQAEEITAQANKAAVAAAQDPNVEKIVVTPVIEGFQAASTNGSTLPKVVDIRSQSKEASPKSNSKTSVKISVSRSNTISTPSTSQPHKKAKKSPEAQKPITQIFEKIIIPTVDQPVKQGRRKKANPTLRISEAEVLTKAEQMGAAMQFQDIHLPEVESLVRSYQQNPSLMSTLCTRPQQQAPAPPTSTSNVGAVDNIRANYRAIIEQKAGGHHIGSPLGTTQFPLQMLYPDCLKALGMGHTAEVKRYDPMGEAEARRDSHMAKFVHSKFGIKEDAAHGIEVVSDITAHGGKVYANIAKESVFLTKIGKGIDDNRLKRILSSLFGEMEFVKVLCDPRLNKTRGYAVVSFRSQESTNLCISQSPFIIGGAQVFATKAYPLQSQFCPAVNSSDTLPFSHIATQYITVVDSACHQILMENQPSLMELKMRDGHLQELEDYVRQIFPGTVLSVYGSLRNGFGFTHSDLNISLTFKRNTTDFDCLSVIDKLAKSLCLNPKLSNVVAITSAKVPIVKFVFKESGLEGDISLYNTLAQHNTRMLDMYCKIDQRVRVLGYTLKYFAKILNIGDTSRGSLSSYAYILMVLFFLQQRDPPVIPVLQELYNGKQPILMVGEWNVWFYDRLENLPSVWPEFGMNTESVGQLWLRLLRFYSEEFDSHEYVVCIRQKKFLTRFRKGWNSQSLAIEDPFNLNHNLGSAVSPKMNGYIIKAFATASNHIVKSLKKIPAEISPKDFLFDHHALCGGQDPPRKGCRYCRKPDHTVNDCPKKTQKMKTINDMEDPSFGHQQGFQERRGYHQRKEYDKRSHHHGNWSPRNNNTQ